MSQMRRTTSQGRVCGWSVRKQEQTRADKSRQEQTRADDGETGNGLQDWSSDLGEDAHEPVNCIDDCL